MRRPPVTRCASKTPSTFCTARTTWPRCAGSPISKVKCSLATRSREVVTAADRMLTPLSDVTRVISDNGVNILSAAVTTSRDRVAKLHFTFEMGDPGHLGHVVRAVQRVDGVFDAHRVTGGRRTDG